MLFLCFASTLSAQAFGTQGTWHFEYRLFGYQYIYEVQYEKDSTINGKTYQALGATGIQYLRTGLHTSQTHTAPKRYFFLRTQNDTVYRLDTNGNDYILYDFNAEVGDSWVIGPSDTALNCSGTPTVTVHAKGTDSINGVAINFWQVSSSGSSSYLVFPSGTIYEHIGFLGSQGLDIMFEPTWQNCDTTKIIGPSPTAMRCYQDPVIGFINRMPRGNDCDSVEAVDLHYTPAQGISIFPNPSTGAFKVESKKQIIDEISIINASGTLLEEIAFRPTNTVTVSRNLSRGIYLLVLKHHGKRVATARLLSQ